MRFIFENFSVTFRELVYSTSKTVFSVITNSFSFILKEFFSFLKLSSINGLELTSDASVSKVAGKSDHPLLF